MINKELKEKLKNHAKKHNEILDEEGRSVINITVYNDDDFLSPYACDTEEIISSEVSEFLEHSVKNVSPKSSLHLHIKSNEIDETEQVKYRTAIKNYYFTKLIDIKRQLRKLTLISIVFMLASLVIFACSAFIPFLSSTPVINEFVIVIGWVFAWEAVDLFCIQRNQINIEKMRYTNLMYAKITYEKLDKK